jgi:hypothetical protein
MESRKYFSNRKYSNGLYKSGISSFEVSEKKGTDICNVNALTDIKELDLSKGENRDINIGTFITYLNNELINFHIKK